jgi:hypothetical protein
LFSLEHADAAGAEDRASHARIIAQDAAPERWRVLTALGGRP